MVVRSSLQVGLVIAALFLTSACTDDASDNGPIEYAAPPAPEPTDRGEPSDLEIEVVEYEAFAPRPGEPGTFDFIVKVVNGGEQSYSWPDPCPSYTWGWSESATNFGNGSQHLNCSRAPDLAPGESVDFQMEIPGAAEEGALRWSWELTVDAPCKGWGSTFNGGVAVINGEITSPHYTYDCPYSWDDTSPMRIPKRG